LLQISIVRKDKREKDWTKEIKSSSVVRKLKKILDTNVLTQIPPALRSSKDA